MTPEEIDELERLYAETQEGANARDWLQALHNAAPALIAAAREVERLRVEVDGGRAHVIALEQQNVALLRWQSVAPDAHVDHLCAIVRSLAVSDETPRVLRDLSAMGVEEEIRRAIAAERINREKSEATAREARKAAEDADARSAEVLAEVDRLRAFVPRWRREDEHTLHLTVGPVALGGIMGPHPESGLWGAMATGDDGVTEHPDLPTAARAVCTRLGIPYVPVEVSDG